MSSELELSQRDARELTDEINAQLERAKDLIIKAYEQRAWASLGYESWDAYCKAEIRVRFSRAERPAIVASMDEAGMPIKSIAGAVHASKNTVRSDLRQRGQFDPFEEKKVIRADGKAYTVKPKPAPEPPIVDAELEPEETELPQATALPQSDLDELNADPPTWQPAGHMRDTDLADLKKTKEEPQKPRRTPITDDATRIGWEIRKAAEKLEKLTTDDRWSHNTEKMTPLLRGHLQYVIETATNAINDLTRKDQ